MLKRLLLFGLFFWGVSSATTAQQSSQAFEQLSQWAKHFIRFTHQNSSWSFDITMEEVQLYRHDTTFIMQAHVDAQDSAANIFWENKALRIRPDSLWFVDDCAGNCVFGPKKYDKTRYIENLYFRITSNHLWGMYSYIRYLLKTSDKFDFTIFDSEYDTVVDNAFYHCIKNVTLSGHRFNPKTEEYDIPLFDTLWYYIDPSTFLTHRIEKRGNVSDNQKIVITIHNFRLPAVAIDSTRFDFESERYDGYAHYLFPQQIPSSEVEIMYEENYRLTDSVKNYPLVNINGDTLYLRDTTGWILLDFWSYGCAACIDFFDEVNAQRKKQGSCALDDAGIAFFCINYRTNNTSYFRDFVEKYCVPENSYSANDMLCLSFYATPTYFLYAPNGDLVFNGNAKNIKDIIKAKKRYERKFKK